MDVIRKKQSDCRFTEEMESKITRIYEAEN